MKQALWYKVLTLSIQKSDGNIASFDIHFCKFKKNFKTYKNIILKKKKKLNSILNLMLKKKYKYLFNCLRKHTIFSKFEI